MWIATFMDFFQLYYFLISVLFLFIKYTFNEGHEGHGKLCSFNWKKSDIGIITGVTLIDFKRF